MFLAQRLLNLFFTERFDRVVYYLLYFYWLYGHDRDNSYSWDRNTGSLG
jgi:hypothetical protein